MTSNYERVYTSWQDEEVKSMLSIFNDENIIGQMDSKSVRHKNLFKIVEQRLSLIGIFKSEKQIATKYKNLKLKYYQLKKDNHKSGAAPANFLFYDQLDCILASRPKSLASKYGCDTSIGHSEDERGVDPEIELADAEIEDDIHQNNGNDEDDNVNLANSQPSKKRKLGKIQDSN